MRPGQRFGLSAIEKNEIWRRWKAGQTLHEIGRAFEIESTRNIDNTRVNFLHFRREIQNLSGESPGLPAKFGSYARFGRQALEDFRTCTVDIYCFCLTT
jgi:hypothetical protein